MGPTPIFLLYSALTLPMLLGCTGIETKVKDPGLKYAIDRTHGKVSPEITGYWRSVGNGYLLEARKDSILLYSYTEGFCYKEKNDYLEGLLNSESRFLMRQDTLGIYLTDFGERTGWLQTKKDFVRVGGLPKDCIGFPDMQELGNRELFGLYLETLEENYAFKKERGLDWGQLYQSYMDSIKTGKESLFRAMGRVAEMTGDQHTKVIAPDGRTLQYRGTPSAEIVQQAFAGQSEETDLNAYFGSFFATNYGNISDSLLQGKGKKALNGRLEYGDLTDDIGYLNIHSLTGFLGKGHTRRQEVDSLDLHMAEIIEYFGDKKALIVDISFNFGGYDAAGLIIAGHFADAPAFAYTSQVYNNGSFHDEGKVMVSPAGSARFTKPVYVLMTDISRSAAESFAMMMGSLPNVKLVGTRTLGTLSGMLGKSIGEYYTTCSNQRLLLPDGTHYEGLGVGPDIGLELFSRERVFDGHMEAVRKVCEIIEGRARDE